MFLFLKKVLVFCFNKELIKNSDAQSTLNNTINYRY